MQRTLVTMALAALCASATARPDDKADALLKEVEAATKAAQTLTADLSLRNIQADNNTKEATGSIKLMKPNFARIEIGAPHLMTTASDGKTIWRLSQRSKSYRKSKVDAQGRFITALWALPVMNFFYPEFGTSKAKTTYLGEQLWNGRKYQVVSVQEKVADTPLDVSYYIGADKLVHRTVQKVDVEGKIVVAESSLSNIRVNEPMAPADFAFLPSADFKAADETKPKVTLLPVGETAPEFDLATPQGGRVTLTDALQGKKVLLLNFWFYS